MANKILTCGQCGKLFRTWKDYIDQDQDEGYGICRSCQKDNKKLAHKWLDEMIEQLHNELPTDQLEKFKTYTHHQKRIIVMRLMDEGKISFGPVRTNRGN